MPRRTLSIVLLLAACGTQSDGPPQPPDRTELCADIHNFYDCALRIEAARLDRQDRVTRTGDTLLIRLPDGGEVRLVDRGTQAETVRFAYAGFLDRVGYHLVSVHYYEGAEYRLIDGATGETTEVAAWPVVSPEGRRIAVASNAGVAGYAPNLLQLWRVTGDGLEVEWETRPDDWGADSARWADSTTLRFDRTSLCEGEICRSDAVLRWVDGEWSVTGDG